MKKRQLTFLTAALLAFSAGTANAATISYQATDLKTDPPSGGDLWQYTYTVNGHTFAKDQGFTIYFDPDLYAGLESSPAAPDDRWDVLTWNPSPGFSASGAYDAMFLGDQDTAAGGFTVSFLWLSTLSPPGSQPFEIYDTDFSVLDTGTTAAVPVPTTVMLFGSGMAGLLGLRKRAMKKS